jgi:hypothetical protein
MSDGPTRGASEDRAWSARPGQAWLLRVSVYLAPILVSFLVTRFASAGFWHPAGWVGLGAYLAQGAVVGTAAALLTGRSVRRLLPLASMFNMTLVFPDRAPSRFGVALKTGTVTQLRRQLANSEISWPSDDQEAAELLVAMVSALGRHDRLTRGHTERVRAFADLIGEELGLAAADRELLHWGATVHDVGKLTVPPEILNKDGRPTEAEWAILQSHPEAGGRILEPLAGWLGDWRLAASQHHERWDGNGYPAGLSGHQISLAGRIVAVADAFDVITSHRSYKKAMSPTAAREEMVRCADAQFDPTVVRALLSASLTKDRAALGFFGWLAELNGLTAVPRAVSQVVTTLAVAAAVTAGAASVNPLVVDDHSQGIAAVATTSGRPAALAYRDIETVPTSAPSTTGDSSAVPADPAINRSEVTTTTTAAPASSAASSTTLVSTITTTPEPATQPSTTTSSSPTTVPTTSTTSATTTTTSPTTTTTLATTTTTSATTTTTAPTSTTTPGSPLAVADDVSVETHQSIRIYPLTNDDPGNSPFDEDTLSIVVSPQHAENFFVHNDHVHYRSETGYTGPDNLDYRICNTNGLCHIATVTITVTP